MRTFLSLALVASASAFSGVAPAPMTSKVSMSKVARTPELEMQASSKATVIGAAAVGGIVGVYFFHELQTGLILAAVLAYASTTASQFGGVAESAGETAVKVYDKTLELNAQYDLLPKVSTRPPLRLPCLGRVITSLSPAPSHLDPPPPTPSSAREPNCRPTLYLPPAASSSGCVAQHPPSFPRAAEVRHRHRHDRREQPRQELRCARQLCAGRAAQPSHALFTTTPFTVAHAHAMWVASHYTECLGLRAATGFTTKIDEQLKISQAVDKASAKVNELKSSVTDKVDDLKTKATE
jgi:hypothetical protein